MTQMVKNLPALRETWVRFLGWEESLEEGMQPTPGFLPGESHGQRTLGGLQSVGLQRVGHDCATKHSRVGVVEYSTRLCFFTMNLGRGVQCFTFSLVKRDKTISKSH